MGRRKTGQRAKATRPMAEASPEPAEWSFGLDDELLTGRWPEPDAPESRAASAAEPAAEFVMQPLRLPVAAEASAAVAPAVGPAPASPAVIAQVEILAAPPALAPRAVQPRPQTVQVIASGTVQGIAARPAPRTLGAPSLRPAAKTVVERAPGQWPGRAPTGAFGIFESDTLVFKGEAETG